MPDMDALNRGQNGNGSHGTDNDTLFLLGGVALRRLRRRVDSVEPAAPDVSSGRSASAICTDGVMPDVERYLKLRSM